MSRSPATLVIGWCLAWFCFAGIDSARGELWEVVRSKTGDLEGTTNVIVGTYKSMDDAIAAATKMNKTAGLYLIYVPRISVKVVSTSPQSPKAEDTKDPKSSNNLPATDGGSQTAGTDVGKKLLEMDDRRQLQIEQIGLQADEARLKRDKSEMQLLLKKIVDGKTAGEDTKELEALYVKKKKQYDGDLENYTKRLNQAGEAARGIRTRIDKIRESAFEIAMKKRQEQELANKRARQLAEQREKELAEQRAKELADQRAKELEDKKVKELAEKRRLELATPSIAGTSWDLARGGDRRGGVYIFATGGAGAYGNSRGTAKIGFRWTQSGNKVSITYDGSSRDLNRSGSETATISGNQLLTRGSEIYIRELEDEGEAPPPPPTSSKSEADFIGTWTHGYTHATSRIAIFDELIVRPDGSASHRQRQNGVWGETYSYRWKLVGNKIHLRYGDGDFNDWGDFFGKAKKSN